MAEQERPIGRIRSELSHATSCPIDLRDFVTIDRGALQAGNEQRPARASIAIFVRASEPTIDRTIRPVIRPYQYSRLASTQCDPYTRASLEGRIITLINISNNNTNTVL